MSKKLKTLRDIIPASEDWDRPEASHVPFGEKNKYGKTLHHYDGWNGADCGDGWNGVYSGEIVRMFLRQAAKEWIYHWEKEGKEARKQNIPILASMYQQLANEFKHFFNLEDEK